VEKLYGKNKYSHWSAQLGFREQSFQFTLYKICTRAACRTAADTNSEDIWNNWTKNKRL